jgi:replication-associated recombination protein RarA
MSKATSMIRIHTEARDLLKEISESDRRSMIDTLDILLLEACKKQQGKE